MQFFKYLKVATNMPQPKTLPFAPLLSALVIYLLSVFLYGGNAWFPLIAVFAYFVCVIVFCTCYSTPNLEAVFPVSHNKKVFYRFMTALFLFVTMTVFIAVIAFIIIVAVQLFEAKALSDLFVSFKNTFVKAGVYGSLYGVAYLIISFSAGMITGFIKSRKLRNIYLVCLCVALLLSNLFIMLPYYIANHTFSGAGAFSQACYNAMALPWLCITFLFIVAFACLGLAIYSGVKYYDPKKF